MNLVVEQVEAEGGLRLLLTIQLSLKGPDLFRCCKAHRQSPSLTIFESALEVRVLSSAGATRPQQSYDPVRLPSAPPPESDLEAATPAQNASPLSSVPCPIPRRIEAGASVDCIPAHAAFPEMKAGRHPH